MPLVTLPEYSAPKQLTYKLERDVPETENTVLYAALYP